jgi:hypothetical protein
MEQTLHFQEIILAHTHFTFYNCGIANTLYIMQNSKHDKGKDAGKAFLIIKFGSISKEEKDLYGFVHTHSTASGELVHMTRWRRLSSQRITFHIDQYYSTLCTSYANYKRHMSSIIPDTQELVNELKAAPKTLALRTMVGFSHAQQTAELLSDVRYLYMNAFSEFSCAKQFIMDKYTKPLSNCMEFFIFNKIAKFEQLKYHYDNHGVRQRHARYVDNMRDLNTLGGKLDLPSIFFEGTRLMSMQDLLDEMFLYVHTNKEPSTPYHEYVKAVKTIEKYQKIYENLQLKFKTGEFTEYSDFKTFFLDKGYVGHHAASTYIGAELLTAHLDGASIKSKVETYLQSESLLEMNSTKSIIPERSRENLIISLTTDTDALNPGGKGKKTALWKSLCVSEDPYSITVKTHKRDQQDNLIVLTGTNRCKVHDSTLDIVQNLGITRTVDLALWNILHNNSRVHTDISIKAQYAAKRELY